MADYDNSGGEYKSNLSEVDQARAEIIRNLLNKINLPNDDLVEISGLNDETIASIRQSKYADQQDPEEPLSWDYVMVFDVGGEEDLHKPNKNDKKRKEAENIPDSEEWTEGMKSQKYNGQVMYDFLKRLEYAKLAVKPFRSPDKLKMFLVIGITEKNLKLWADLRDADLLIDPTGAIEVGCKMGFPLALRTEKQELDISNWDYLYVEYHPNADPKIYTQYNRIKGDESIKTVFDEKTRLRIIYECITTDQNDGGAEIALEDLVADKKHPLEACFALHDPDVLKKFDDDWIKNWKCSSLMWCPLPEIRDYFGEPVAFYFAFLSFYLKWLLIPSFFGFIFFVLQISGIGARDNVGYEGYNGIAFDVQGLFIMGFIIIIWSVAFVDFWLREEARYRMRWGMSSYEDKAVARPQFKGEWRPDPVTGLFSEQFDFARKLCRVSVVFSGLVFFLALCIVAVIFVLISKDSDPNNTGLKIGIGVANGIMIFVFNAIYKLSSGRGNDYENHKTQQDYENALITKGFIFKFINSFASLFYLAFIRPTVKGNGYYVRFYQTVCGNSADSMQQYVLNYNTALETNPSLVDGLVKPIDKKGALVSSCVATGDPKEDNHCIEKVHNNPVWEIAYTGYTVNGVTYAPWDGTSAVNATTSVVCNNNQVIEQINEAVLNEVFFQLATLFITAIVIQNGAEVGIPFLVACIKGNAREKQAKKDGRKLEPQSEAEIQGEKAPYENTIEDMTELIVQFGYVTLFVMAFPLTPLLAVLNNVIEMKVDAINLVKTSQRPHPMGSSGLGSWNSVLAFFSIVSVATNVAMITFRTGAVNVFFAAEGRSNADQWIFFSLLSVLLGLIVALEKWIIPDVPEQCLLVQERQRLVENVLVRQAKVDPFEEQPPDTSDDIETNEFPFDPDKKFVDSEQLQPIPLENIQWTKFNETA